MNTFKSISWDQNILEIISTNKLSPLQQPEELSPWMQKSEKELADSIR